MTSVYSSDLLLGNRQKSWQAIISELYTALDINIPDRPDFFGRISRTNSRFRRNYRGHDRSGAGETNAPPYFARHTGVLSFSAPDKGRSSHFPV